MMVEDLQEAESVFRTNALMGAVPAISVDGKAIVVDGLCAKIQRSLVRLEHRTGRP